MTYRKRLAAIVLVVFLYAIVGYQSYPRWTPSVKAYDNHAFPNNYDRVHPDKKASPVFEEGFVNSRKPHTISHVSSVVSTRNNKVVCAWYAGSKESAPDVAIFFSSYDESKKTWSEPMSLVDRQSSSQELQRYVRKVGNPMLFSAADGGLWLFYSSVSLGGWSGSTINYKVSMDDGQHWSTARKLILSPFFNLSSNVKNDGIPLDDGAFIIPSYHEFIRKYSQLIHVTSENGLVRYEIRKMTGDTDIIQPVILPAGNNNIVSFFRNSAHASRRFIRTSVSSDGGESWSSAHNTHLPNPNSGFDITIQTNGAYLAVINNTFKNRNNLSLVQSHDEGKSWRLLHVFETNPDPTEEFSYPSLAALYNVKDGRHYVLTYTHKKTRIKYVVFNEAWIAKLEQEVARKHAS